MSDSWVAVLSDAHLGDAHSWLERDALQHGVVSALSSRPSATTLILLGDTLDLNFGSLTTAIEGRLPDPNRRPGLRALLTAVCSRTAVDKIVYVPGNHDYMIWEWEARRANVLTPLANGQHLGGKVMVSGTIADHFVAGLLPRGRQGCLSVAFPHYTGSVGNHNVVLTHGHYLDRIQTGGVALAKVAEAEDPKAFLRHLSIASAQYQAFAHAIAIRRRSRTGIRQLYTRVARWYDVWRSLRGSRPSEATLRAIDVYLQLVVDVTEPSAFVFGHTHRPGRWLTRGDRARSWRPTPVYNCGSFVPPRKTEASMLLLSPDQGELAVELISFTPSGEESTRRLSHGRAM